jgi:hypothetical protein
MNIEIGNGVSQQRHSIYLNGIYISYTTVFIRPWQEVIKISMIMMIKEEPFAVIYG